MIIQQPIHVHTAALDMACTNAALVMRIAKLERRVAVLERQLSPKVRRKAKPNDDHQAICFAAALVIAEETGFTIDHLRGRRGPLALSAARQDAYAMARDAGATASQIGVFFRRDHSTVLHGIETARGRK